MNRNITRESKKMKIKEKREEMKKELEAFGEECLFYAHDVHILITKKGLSKEDAEKTKGKLLRCLCREYASRIEDKQRRWLLGEEMEFLNNRVLELKAKTGGAFLEEVRILAWQETFQNFGAKQMHLKMSLFNRETHERNYLIFARYARGESVSHLMSVFDLSKKQIYKIIGEVRKRQKELTTGKKVNLHL
jgi:hypothetical protein